MFLIQEYDVIIENGLEEYMGLAETFKALSEPLRRGILEYLKNGRMTAGELADKLNITPAALSYHLRLLRQADLVMEYKYKNFIYYELNTSVLDELILWTKQFGGKKDEKKNSVDGHDNAVTDYGCGN